MAKVKTHCDQLQSFNCEEMVVSFSLVGAAGACIKQVFKHWRWPRPAGSHFTVVRLISAEPALTGPKQARPNQAQVPTIRRLGNQEALYH